MGVLISWSCLSISTSILSRSLLVNYCLIRCNNSTYFLSETASSYKFGKTIFFPLVEFVGRVRRIKRTKILLPNKVNLVSFCGSQGKQPLIGWKPWKCLFSPLYKQGSWLQPKTRETKNRSLCNYCFLYIQTFSVIMLPFHSPRRNLESP